MDITYDQWVDKISDPATATIIDNIGTTTQLEVPPAEFLWKLTDGYKKAQDALNQNQGGTLPTLATVDLLVFGPNVESENGRPFVRGRAQVQCNIFLQDNDVRGVTLI